LTMHTMTRKRMVNLLWPRFSSTMDVLNRNAEMFTAFRGHAADSVEKLANRKQLYTAINEKLRNQAITYLEFGVWKGESLHAWTEINTHSDSRFYGFDSFEGLPENWNHGFGRATTRGQFDLGGRVPDFADSRVTLIKGWFQNTLGRFLQETALPHPLVVNNDSDLHSSTLYTLCTLDSVLEAGDIVIFDEYASPVNEYLAWKQYQSAFLRKARCIAMSDRWSQAAFVLT
jgi:O-methyltransferase